MIAVVLPARNEARQIDQVLARIPSRLGGSEVGVIVVDDASTDGTGDLARARGATVVTNARPLGKGGALRRGCDLAVSRGCATLVTIDADGQHRPEDIAQMVAPITAGAAQMVHGRRHFGNAMPMVFRIGNTFLDLCLRALFGVRAHDSQCGFNAFASDIYPTIRWAANDYAIESEILVRLAATGRRPVEVPIETIYHERSKGTGPTDGLRILLKLLRWRRRLPVAPPVTA